MENENVPTILHLIEEVPDFKSFISKDIVDGDEEFARPYKGSSIQILTDAQ